MGIVRNTKGKPRKVDYMAVYEDYKKGMEQYALACKHQCSRQTVRFITCFGVYFEREFHDRMKELEAYSPEALMRRLAVLGYYGTLKKEVLIDITKL